MQHPLLTFLGVLFQYLVSTVLEHLTVTVAVYFYAPLLIVFQK
jgi:hypothetical protein